MDVRIRCVCPGEEVRHPEGDTITLRDRLDFSQAMSCKQAMAIAEADVPTRMAALIRQYLLVGIERWTLMNGKAIPVSHDSIEQYVLSDFGVANAVSEEAENLYNAQVLLPLLGPASTSSQPTPTAGSTSRTNGSTRKPRKPSKRSSTSTSPTDDTAPTT